MGKKYTHLSFAERTCIYWWLKDRISIREMARRLGRHHSTVSREMRRNLWYANTEYFPSGAQKIYEWRLRRRAKRLRLKSDFTRNYVVERLKAGWTPELIAGRLRRQYPEHAVCHEAIYQFIYKEQPALHQLLPRKHKKRREKRPYRKSVSAIKNRVSVQHRPPRANSRTLLGHWESDSVISSCRKLALNVLIERKSRLVHISLMKEKTAECNHQTIVKRLNNYSPKLVRSITYDNGTENTSHQKTNQSLKTKSFFCEPYHSWEKGSVEQVNGLIRRFIPKGSDFNSISSNDINRIEKLLNNRPRKCLNYQTPYEVFRNLSGALSG